MLKVSLASKLENIVFFVCFFGVGGGWGERQKQTDREKKTEREREIENRKSPPKRYSDKDRERAGTLKDHRDTQLSLKNVP